MAINGNGNGNGNGGHAAQLFVDPERYIGPVAFERLLGRFENIGTAIKGFNWVGEAKQRHIRHVETSLSLAAGEAVHPKILESMFGNDHRILRIGKGLFLTLEKGAAQENAQPITEDALRYVSGYPLNLVFFLSRNPEKEKYLDIPPYLGSYALAHMVELKPLHGPEPRPHEKGDFFDDVSPEDFRYQ